GYSDWVRQRKVPERDVPTAPAPKRGTTTEAEPRKRRLTYKETSELAALPDEIGKLEAEREQLYTSLADPVFLRDGAAVSAASVRLKELDVEISQFMLRWEELETIAVNS
ncbi:MAG: ABC transporter C-terminal domain-containing protein, partial [Gemmatimonadaceae bacterium]